MSTWALEAISNAFSASEYSEQVDFIHRESRRVAQSFEQYDALLTPTAANHLCPLGVLNYLPKIVLRFHFLRKFPMRGLINKALKALATNAISATPNTMLFNQTGQPGISVPPYWNADDLPIGSQIVGKFGGETTLLQPARELEIAQPWSDKNPTAAIIQSNTFQSTNDQNVHFEPVLHIFST